MSHLGPVAPLRACGKANAYPNHQVFLTKMAVPVSLSHRQKGSYRKQEPRRDPIIRVGSPLAEEWGILSGSKLWFWP